MTRRTWSNEFPDDLVAKLAHEVSELLSPIQARSNSFEVRLERSVEECRASQGHEDVTHDGALEGMNAYRGSRCHFQAQSMFPFESKRPEFGQERSVPASIDSPWLHAPAEAPLDIVRRKEQTCDDLLDDVPCLERQSQSSAKEFDQLQCTTVALQKQHRPTSRFCGSSVVCDEQLVVDEESFFCDHAGLEIQSAFSSMQPRLPGQRGRNSRFGFPSDIDAASIDTQSTFDPDDAGKSRHAASASHGRPFVVYDQQKEGDTQAHSAMNGKSLREAFEFEALPPRGVWSSVASGFDLQSLSETVDSASADASPGGTAPCVEKDDKRGIAAGSASTSPRQSQENSPRDGIGELELSTFSLDTKGGSMSRRTSTTSSVTTPRIRRIEQQRVEMAARKLQDMHREELSKASSLTFRPQITLLASKMNRSHAAGPPLDPSRKIIAERKEAYMAEKQQKEDADCSFKPQVNRAPPRPSHSGKLHIERLMKWTAERREKEEEQLTFRPQISSRSRRLCEYLQNSTANGKEPAWVQRLSVSKSSHEAGHASKPKAPLATVSKRDSAMLSTEGRSRTSVRIARKASKSCSQFAPSSRHSADGRSCTDDVESEQKRRTTTVQGNFGWLEELLQEHARITPQAYDGQEAEDTSAASAEIKSDSECRVDGRLGVDAKPSHPSDETVVDNIDDALEPSASLVKTGAEGETPNTVTANLDPQLLPQATEVKAETETTPMKNRRHVADAEPGLSSDAKAARSASASAAALAAKAGLRALTKQEVKTPTLRSNRQHLRVADGEGGIQRRGSAKVLPVAFEPRMTLGQTEAVDTPRFEVAEDSVLQSAAGLIPEYNHMQR